MGRGTGRWYNPLMRLIDTGNVTDVLSYLDTKGYSRDRCITLAGKYPDVKYRMFLAIQKAAKLGYVNVIDALIGRGFTHDPNGHPEDPPIHAACTAGHLDVVKSLVENHGVSPDQEGGEFGNTPLIAVLNSNPGNTMDIVQYLLSVEASVNKQNIFEVTPLHCAVRQSSVEMCQLLVSNGANVNACDDDNESPISTAVDMDQADMVQYLLDAGADPNIGHNCYGNKPFQAAVRDCNLPMMKLLYIGGANVDCFLSKGMSPLHFAAYNSNNQMAKYLAVEAAACLDSSDEDGDTPFKMAFDRYNLEMADLLVRLGYTPLEKELIFFSRDANWRKEISKEHDSDFIEYYVGLLKAREEEWITKPAVADAFKSWRRIMSNPRRLQELCINRIRRISFPGRHLSSAVELLPLPQKFKDYLIRS